MFAIGWTIGGALCLPTGGDAAPQTPASAPSTSQPATMPTADVLCARGRAARVAGDPATAIRLLTQAVLQCPDNFDYVSELARAQALRQDWPAVKKLLSPIQEKLDADGLVLLAGACAETGLTARAANVLERGLRRQPDSETLWLALIDHTLKLRQCALALERVGEAQRHLGATPQLQFRMAQAYYRLGQVLGRTQVIRIPGGRVGQLHNDWLLIERSDETDRFVCCPPASALYALRRALDAGLDEPAAHLLHARIWQQAGRPEIGLAILQSREALWLESASAETLATFAEIALAANALDDFLRYARLRAAREPQRRTEILFDAFTAAAERYNQRGDLTMSRELLRRAVALRPENVAVTLQLADAVWDTGDRAEAATWYRRVLEREPAHPARRRILERLGE
ncbi:MAG: tetratricopeptide repeat protein [Planctomycetes bacterium]|nr:tetratricopeptide repeat protein [Planctomycetota bacterium]